VGDYVLNCEPGHTQESISQIRVDNFLGIRL